MPFIKLFPSCKLHIGTIYSFYFAVKILNQARAEGGAPGFLKSLSFRQSMCVCVHPRGHK